MNGGNKTGVRVQTASKAECDRRGSCQPHKKKKQEKEKQKENQKQKEKKRKKKKKQTATHYVTAWS
jgi:hypothetical protein